MYLIYISYYCIIFTFLYSSHIKETEKINCCPQNLTKNLNIPYSKVELYPSDKVLYPIEKQKRLQQNE